jgi:hypothetical protein
MLRQVHDQGRHPLDRRLLSKTCIVALLAAVGLSSSSCKPDGVTRDDAGAGDPFCSGPFLTGSVVTEVPGNLVLRDVYGSAPADVWVTTEPAGAVLHWDGASWSVASPLANTNVVTIRGSGASDVWFGGAAGALWHWDGTGLSQVTSDTSQDITALYVLAADSAFASAFAPDEGGTGDLLRLSGTKWTRVAQVDPGGFGSRYGAALYAPSSEEAWLVTESGAFHFVGGQATKVSMPHMPQTLWGDGPNDVWFGQDRWDGSTVVSTGADQCFAVWGTGPNDVWCGYAHWDGVGFTDYSATVPGGFPYRLLGLSSSDVWATGYPPAHWDGTQWNPVGQVPAGGVGSVTGIWPIGTLALWVTTQYDQVDLWDGQNLTPIPRTAAVPLTDGSLRSVWAASTSDVWAVGDNGLIIHFDGGSWSVVASPTTAKLNGVFGSASNDVWAVGDEGVILRWDGGTWSSEASPTDAGLSAVWAEAGLVVSVGERGSIVANSGSGFATQSSGVNATLSSVWGRSQTEVYATGSATEFYGTSSPPEVEFDGQAWRPLAEPSLACVSSVWGAEDGLFANGYYIDGGGAAVRVVPSFPPPYGMSAPVCLMVGSVWASARSDIWAIAKVHVSDGVDDGPFGIVTDAGSCWSGVGDNPFFAYRTFGPGRDLHAIFGLGAHDVWAVGDLGVVVHVRR